MSTIESNDSYDIERNHNSHNLPSWRPIQRQQLPYAKYIVNSFILESTRIGPLPNTTNCGRSFDNRRRRRRHPPHSNNSCNLPNLDCRFFA